MLLYGEQVHLAARLLLALGLDALMLGVAIRERQQPLAWPALLRALGIASYSIYLVPNPLLSFRQRLAGWFGLGWLNGWLWGVAASLLLGYLYFLWVEEPLLRFLRARTKTR